MSLFIIEAWISCKSQIHKVLRREKKAIEKQKRKKRQSSQPFRSSQSPLLHIDTAISISGSLSGRLTTALCFGQRSPRIGLLWGPVTHPEEPDSGLQSGLSSLNHHDQKVNTVHESITQGGELMAPCDPGVSLIQTTNLSDSQIIGNLLDSVENEIFTLIIHSVQGCISSPSVPPWVRLHSCTQQARKCNAWMEMSLSRWTISFSASLLPLSSYLFLYSFFSLHLCLLTHSGWLVMAFLFRFFCSFAVTHSQSPTLTVLPSDA